MPGESASSNASEGSFSCKTASLVNPCAALAWLRDCPPLLTYSLELLGCEAPYLHYHELGRQVIGLFQMARKHGPTDEIEANE